MGSLIALKEITRLRGRFYLSTPLLLLIKARGGGRVCACVCTFSLKSERCLKERCDFNIENKKNTNILIPVNQIKQTLLYSRCTVKAMISARIYDRIHTSCKECLQLLRNASDSDALILTFLHYSEITL